MIISKNHFKLLQRSGNGNSVIFQTAKGSNDNKIGFLIRTSSSTENLGTYGESWVSEFTIPYDHNKLSENERLVLKSCIQKLDPASVVHALVLFGFPVDYSISSVGTRVCLNNESVFDIEDVKTIDFVDGVAILDINGGTKTVRVNDESRDKLIEIYLSRGAGFVTVKE